jgi:hypothetical protein
MMCICAEDAFEERKKPTLLFDDVDNSPLIQILSFEILHESCPFSSNPVTIQ